MDSAALEQLHTLRGEVELWLRSLPLARAYFVADLPVTCLGPTHIAITAAISYYDSGIQSQFRKNTFAA
jgi:hypothetical protein